MAAAAAGRGKKDEKDWKGFGGIWKGRSSEFGTLGRMNGTKNGGEAAVLSSSGVMRGFLKMKDTVVPVCCSCSSCRLPLLLFLLLLL